MHECGGKTGSKKKRITRIHPRVVRGVGELPMCCPGFERVDGEGNW